MVQWYECNRQLYDEEIRYMAENMPHAMHGFLPNGNMYSIIETHPIISGQRKDWTLLAVYDSDHPHRRWGGSVKFYPIKPNYEEMLRRVNNSNVTPNSIPHLLRDETNQIYISAVNHEQIVINATTALANVMRWISMFEIGLTNQNIWSVFCGTGKLDSKYSCISSDIKRLNGEEEM